MLCCGQIYGEARVRGVAFSDAVLRDPGGKDFQDIMHGVDYLIEQGRVDSNRVGILGWSYGGIHDEHGRSHRRHALRRQ